MKKDDLPTLLALLLYAFLMVSLIIIIILSLYKIYKSEFVTIRNEVKIVMNIKQGGHYYGY